MQIMRISAIQQMGLIYCLKGCKLPFQVTYNIKKNMNALNHLAVNYENARIGLLKKYAQKDENGEFISNDNKAILDNEEEFNRLLSTELYAVEEVNIRMIKLSDLLETQLTIEQLEALQFMIEDEAG